MRKPKPPKTFDEVEAYIKEKGYNVDPRVFWDYFEANDWYDVNDVPVRRWKGKVVTWHYRDPKTIAAIKAKKFDAAQERRNRKREREQCEAWLSNKTTAALLDLKKDKSAIVPHWLIDEIINKRAK